MTLDADPTSNTVMLSVVEQNRQVSFAAWDGDAWGAPQLLGADAGTNRGQPFLFLWDSEVNSIVPTIKVTGPATIEQNQVYTLDFKAVYSGPPATIVGWTINWGDGTIDQVGDVTSASHTYTQAGFTRNITVSVTDSNDTYTAGDIFLDQQHYRAACSDSMGRPGACFRSSPTLDGLTQSDRRGDRARWPDLYVTAFGSDDIRRYDPTTEPSSISSLPG